LRPRADPGSDATPLAVISIPKVRSPNQFHAGTHASTPSLAVVAQHVAAPQGATHDVATQHSVPSPSAAAAARPATRLTKGKSHSGLGPVQTRAPRSSLMPGGQNRMLPSSMPAVSAGPAVASRSSNPAGASRTPTAVLRSDASHTVQSESDAPDSQPSMPAPRAPLQPSSSGANAGAGVGAGGGATAIAALETALCATWLLLWWRLRTDRRPWRSRLGARPLERPG
jgi:hypothetical protein